MKITAGPSGREVISLQKVDSSLLVLVDVREAKKVSARRHNSELGLLVVGFY